MPKSVLKDLIRLSKFYRIPLGLMVFAYEDERKVCKTDREALEWLIEDLAEGAIS